MELRKGDGKPCRGHRPDHAAIVSQWLPQPRIRHPWPNQRFAVKYPRWKPYSGKPYVRTCAGRIAIFVPTGSISPPGDGPFRFFLFGKGVFLWFCSARTSKSILVVDGRFLRPLRL
jgi:hypothetical protein